MHDKPNDRISDLKAERATTARREIKVEAILAQAGAAGAFTPELIAKIADLDKISVKGGKAYGTNEVIEEIRLEHPELFESHPRRGRDQRTGTNKAFAGPPRGMARPNAHIYMSTRMPSRTKM